jgi:membrane protein YqaA with SNARE-associated domain
MMARQGWMNRAAMLEALMTILDQPEPTRKPKGLRAIYAWMLANAQGRHAWAAVAAFAFAEASFFPIPADVMVLPMMLADRKRVFRLGAWVAFWSVAGGVLGYAIGHLFWETAGLWLIHLLHVPLAQVEALRAKYSSNAYLIMIQGATPIPYKLVTIASGLAGVSFPLFMLYSAVTRSIRYLVIEAMLVYFFGEKAQVLLEKYLEVALILFVVALILGFVALKYL